MKPQQQETILNYIRQERRRRKAAHRRDCIVAILQAIGIGVIIGTTLSLVLWTYEHL